MSTGEPSYFARVTAGLERVAWVDIERCVDATGAEFGHRRVDFRTPAAPAALLALRSVDDVYAYLARLEGLDHTRASLGRLARQVEQIDFEPALDILRAARTVADRPSFRVTSSHLGRRNYSRYDVEGAAADAIVARLPWRFVPNAPDEEEPDLDLRVLLEDNWALLGLRLGATPLHRRAYKVADQPGSLKAPVAYCMGLLAELAPGARLLDLTCGAGTILVEGQSLAPGGALIGVDIAPAAIEAAAANLQAAGLAPELLAPEALRDAVAAAAPATETAAWLCQADATQLALPEHSVDAVVSNMPWGKQVADAADLGQLYGGLLGVAARVLVSGGHAALLTDQAGPLMDALASQPRLRLVSSLPISLFGRHPTVYLLQADP